MKKFLVAGLLIAVAGAGLFLLLRSQLTKSELYLRMDELFDSANGFRTGLGVKEYDLEAFFDAENYDPESTHYSNWIEEWKNQNIQPDFLRRLEEVEVKETKGDVVTAELTVSEGLKGDDKKGVEEQMEKVKYRAVLFHDVKRSLWLVRALDRLD